MKDLVIAAAVTLIGASAAQASAGVPQASAGVPQTITQDNQVGDWRFVGAFDSGVVGFDRSSIVSDGALRTFRWVHVSAPYEAEGWGAIEEERIFYVVHATINCEALTSTEGRVLFFRMDGRPLRNEIGDPEQVFAPSSIYGELKQYVCDGLSRDGEIFFTLMNFATSIRSQMNWGYFD
ncbi:MAG: hypothetical protein Q8R45_09800 [Brevundimonas sp.]|uniref:hypothetical protein n=1 Tax=Brevundimonas sp. TaxID=1871086 RepID=UPI00272242F4|nr:hypothetical protein [Brevundimonas sp.]MDO9587823.1 hypothetical protein [Brevundimonas sp.]MDP3657243.1 hypothetical protein [Brevundimonas sp.]